MNVKVGDKIYVPSSFYCSHGVDDFVGGIATIAHVELGKSAGQDRTFISIVERPGHSYNWDEYLAPAQSQLQRKYQDQIAYPDPDYSPSSNQWD